MDPYSRSGQKFNNILYLSITVFMAVMLFSCENDMAVVHEMTKVDTLPVVTSYDIEIYYSENGKPQFILTSPYALFYTGKESLQEFPDGFHVRFFDSLMQTRSELFADYGINRENTKIMEAQRNVIVLNHEKNERLNTEHMIWDQNKKIIYSEVFVKITTENDVLYGEEGFESDESFNNWVIRKTSGEFEIDAD